MAQRLRRAGWVGSVALVALVVLGMGVGVLSAESPLSPINTRSTLTTLLSQLSPISDEANPHLQPVVQREQSRETTTRPAASPNLSIQHALTSTHCTVTTTLDSGSGSLRACMTPLVSNLNIQFDTAVFTSTNPVTITLATRLPSIRFVAGVTIDASDNWVVLDGNGTVGTGLRILVAEAITIRGLHIVNFEKHGIEIYDHANGITIGGEPNSGEGNRLGNNGENGIDVSDNAHTVEIVGNMIGLDWSGQHAAGNSNGIVVSDGVTNTTIASNTISGSLRDGISLIGGGDHVIVGNKFGTNPAGDAAIPNQENGIYISGKSQNNVIGGADSDQQNLLSGNGLAGVYVDDGIDNHILNNRIGTDATGQSALQNEYGIIVGFGSVGTQIADNQISGNRLLGIQVLGSGTTSTTVTGNVIGISADNSTPLPNSDGIGIMNGATFTQIGGATSTERNIISGNSERGIVIEGSITLSNTIEGNYIGIGSDGQSAIGNNSVGIDLFDDTSYNRILNNTISGNGAGGTCELANGVGIAISGSNSRFNTVQGNFIGTNPTGTSAIHNSRPGILIRLGANNNLVGGDAEGKGNVISGNAGAGVVIFGEGTMFNRVEGNMIGVNAQGNAPIPNENRCEPLPDLFPGLFIDNGGVGVGIGLGASHNIIGGSFSETRNIISGQWHGIEISGTNSLTTTHNQISGNIIGLNIDGTETVPYPFNPFMPRPEAGILITSGVRANIIGGESAEQRNIVSGNQFAIQIQGTDAVENVVQGNYVGTNADGTHALANQVGIIVAFGAQGTRIENNLASGNEEAGIGIASTTTQHTRVCGNIVGLTQDHQQALPNQTGGIELQDGTPNNTLGDLATNCAGNWVGGNTGAGILLRGNVAGMSGNRVADNFIGVDQTGGALPNQGAGVELSGTATDNIIGPNNLIRYNANAGIRLINDTTVQNRLTRNRLYDNAGDPIDWVPNPPLTSPQMLTYTDGVLHGQACAACLIEIFSTPTDTVAAWEYVTRTVADANGAFRVNTFANWPYLTATATDNMSNTSELSDTVLGFSIGTTAQPIAGEPVVFTLPTSDDYITYTWDYGDETARSASEHVYSEAGVYTVTVTGTSQFSQITASTQLTVTASTPTAATLTSVRSITQSIDLFASGYALLVGVLAVLCIRKRMFSSCGS